MFAVTSVLFLDRRSTFDYGSYHMVNVDHRWGTVSERDKQLSIIRGYLENSLGSEWCVTGVTSSIVI